MPIRQVPKSDYKYYLAIHDENGNERAEAGGMLSEKILDAVRNQPITDIFVMSHGWRGDIEGAITQYDAWMGNLMGVGADLERVKKTRENFLPLLIGMHWPSEPWGDEDIGSFGVAPAGGLVQALVDDYAGRLGDTPEIRDALKVIIHAHVTIDDPRSLPPNVIDAYLKLDQLLGLGHGDEDSPPGDDRPEFDPEDVFMAAVQQDDEQSFAGFGFGNLLAPLKFLSFWTMKKRAEVFGEGGANRLLQAIHQAAAGKPVHIHLMGHSFGCIVVSAMAAGTAGSPIIAVDSMVLVQGALSLWSYCAVIPKKKNAAGFFHRILNEARVTGPIVTTQSEYDRAVGVFYPIAAGLKRQVAYAVNLPKYGGVGAYGIQGLDAIATNRKMGSAAEEYSFHPGRIYNLESSQYIKVGGGFSGAHSDIVHPEIAHVIWQALAAGSGGVAANSTE